MATLTTTSSECSTECEEFASILNTLRSKQPLTESFESKLIQHLKKYPWRITAFLHFLGIAFAKDQTVDSNFVESLAQSLNMNICGKYREGHYYSMTAEKTFPGSEPFTRLQKPEASSSSSSINESIIIQSGQKYNFGGYSFTVDQNGNFAQFSAPKGCKIHMDGSTVNAKQLNIPSEDRCFVVESCGTGPTIICDHIRYTRLGHILQNPEPVPKIELSSVSLFSTPASFSKAEFQKNQPNIGVTQSSTFNQQNITFTNLNKNSSMVINDPTQFFSSLKLPAFIHKTTTRTVFDPVSGKKSLVEESHASSKSNVTFDTELTVDGDWNFSDPFTHCGKRKR